MLLCMLGKLGSRKLVSTYATVICSSNDGIIMLDYDIMQKVIADAIKRHGVCSVPYLQRKCKLTHAQARDFLDKYKINLQQISQSEIV